MSLVIITLMDPIMCQWTKSNSYWTFSCLILISHLLRLTSSSFRIGIERSQACWIAFESRVYLQVAMDSLNSWSIPKFNSTNFTLCASQVHSFNTCVFNLDQLYFDVFQSPNLEHSLLSQNWTSPYNFHIIVDSVLSDVIR